MTFKRCSARASHWCSRHGKCECIDTQLDGRRTWSPEINPQCPLHGPDSTHAKSKTWTRRTTS